jgi:hypothetical protein
MKIRFSSIAIASLILASPNPVGACDTCGCFIPTEDGRPLYSRGWFAGVGEQFTYFGTDKLNSRSAPNPTGQYLVSSNSQVIAGYRVTDWFSIQFSLPLIYREYKTPSGVGIERGTVAGLGDIPVVANLTIYRTPPAAKAPGDSKAGSLALNQSGSTDYPDQPFFATVNLLGGIKLPTGNPSRLKDELAPEVDVPGVPPSGIGGHDLALGSGSVDGIAGLAAFVRYHSFFFQADAQYAIRTVGAYGYRYANAISYSGGPGYRLVNRGSTRVGLQFVLSGEDKGVDHLRGAVSDDTGINIVYLGPRLIVSHKDRITMEVGGDLPAYSRNTAFQTIPSYRIRAGFVVRF